MSSAIETYQEAKRLREDANRWTQMFGMRYHGGGGGIGDLRSISVAQAQIYYQETNGATNYHDAPSRMLRALEQVIASRFPELLTNAMNAIDKNLDHLAAEAYKEHRNLMLDAGLDCTKAMTKGQPSSQEE